MFYKFMILNFMFAFALFACGENETIDTSKIRLGKVMSLTSKDSVQVDSVRNLLLSCVEINLSLGNLQSLRRDQNKELYLFGQCLSDPSFDAIWILNKTYENRIKQDNLDSLYNSVTNKNLISKDFNILIFRLPLELVEDPYLDDPYVFPCTVDVDLVTDGAESVTLGTYKIHSWEEYVQLQYKCIFGLKF